MDFDAVLTQVLELLQREKRVSYRALKVRFQLDDYFLEAMKDELIYAKKLAVDEENRVLVWVGEAEEITSPPVQTPQQPTTQATQPTDEPSPAEPRPREAERRQLTVMFCDLVDSTKLSSQLDPEDYREVVRAYQSACTDVIQRYDGHVAQLLGDGLLIYFGYPQAHEDDAQRAIHTGLGILEAIGALNTRLEPDKDIRLAVRLGIHTGLVVVGAMGGAGRQEQLALGEVPNIAARIQGLAEPDTLYISASTYRLIQGYFACQELGEYIIRGVAQPITVYRVLGESGIQSRLDVASSRGLTPLVGRESEVRLLLERWQQAKEGQGQVILLSGEAGIGKSRLVQVLKDHLSGEPHTRQECRCSPYHTNSAFFPLAELLQRRFGWQPEDTADEKLHKLETVLPQTHLDVNTAVPLFTALFSLPLPDDRYPPLQLSSQQQRQHTLEAFLQLLLLAAKQHPVLFIVEDLHWVDPSTLEFLALLLDHTPTTSLYLLATCRPEFQPPWSHRSYLTEITVNHLSRNQIEQMATHVAGGKSLPPEIIQQLMDKTDGVPLYVEEMTKAVLESGLLKEVNGHYALAGSVTSLTIPATLQDSLMARLDRLMTAKMIAQLGAVIGRQFSYALLQAVSELHETMLQHELGRLVEAEVVYQRGLAPQATYHFKHALIRDAAYESLLRSTRQGYHRRIAEVLEERFPEAAETQPELLAHHYTEAGLIERSVRYWQRAGKNAMQRSAYREASIHLSKGLDGLKMLPKTRQRDEDELSLFMDFVMALQVITGSSSVEVEHALNQAQTLCQQVGDLPQHISILLSLRFLRHLRGDLQTAWQIGQQLLRLIDGVDDPGLEMQICYALGHTGFYLGAFETARFHLERGITLHNTLLQRSGSVQVGLFDVLGFCYPPLAWSLWHAGYPDQSLSRIQESLVLIQKNMDNPGNEYLLSSAAMVYQLCGKSALAREHVERAISIATDRGFRFRLAWNVMLQGWIIGAQESVTDGMERMSQGLEEYPAQVPLPWFLALFAAMHGRVGQVEQGLRLMTKAFAMASEIGRCFYDAELHRLQGELFLVQSPDNHPEVESRFHKAIAIAQSQQAKSLELRAATSLATLWQRQGKQQEAYDLLAPVYGWFTEGFDTADLQDAKVLLDALA